MRQAIPTRILDVQLLPEQSDLRRSPIEFGLQTVSLDATGPGPAACEIQGGRGEGYGVENG